MRMQAAPRVLTLENGLVHAKHDYRNVDGPTASLVYFCSSSSHSVLASTRGFFPIPHRCVLILHVFDGMNRHRVHISAPLSFAIDWSCRGCCHCSSVFIFRICISLVTHPQVVPMPSYSPSM